MIKGHIGLSFVISALFTAFVTWQLIPFLRRLKGETVREDVPERHRLKAGTPTMGGLAFVIALSIVALVFNPSWAMLLCSAATVSFALLGFADDWAKLKKQKGWRTQPKLAAQIALAVFWIWLAWQKRVLPPSPSPLMADAVWFAFAVLLLLATVNGVNIADGLDGLAAGLTTVAAGAVAFLSWQQGKVDPSVFAVTLCGSCLGFLFFNRYPAKVFMGDVGSLALGAALGMVVLLGNVALPFLLIGLVFWIEQATVIVQVAYFKWTKRRYGEGRRIFPMTPIHHSFEILGWKEPVIVAAFWLAGIVAAFLGLVVAFYSV